MDLMRQRHGSAIFSEDGSTIDEQVAGLLAGRRIATAESCTAGMVAACPPTAGLCRPTSWAGWCPTPTRRRSHLGVDAGLIAQHGAVSEQVAEATRRLEPVRRPTPRVLDHRDRRSRRGNRRTSPVGTVWFCVKVAGGPTITSSCIRVPGAGRRP